MALTDQQMQFATNVPATPLIDKAMEGFAKGIDHFMNEVVIGGAGRMLDAATTELRSMEKSPIANLSENKLTQGKGHTPDITPSSSPDISQKGNSTEVAKSMVPEKVIAQAQSIGNAGGMKVEHVAEANIGTLAPAYTPSMGAGKSQGMAIG